MKFITPLLLLFIILILLISSASSAFNLSIPTPSIRTTFEDVSSVTPPRFIGADIKKYDYLPIVFNPNLVGMDDGTVDIRLVTAISDIIYNLSVIVKNIARNIAACVHASAMVVIGLWGNLQLLATNIVNTVSYVATFIGTSFTYLLGVIRAFFQFNKWEVQP